MRPARLQINFSEEQEMLLDVAEKFSQDQSPLDRVRKRMAENQPFDTPLWQEIVNLGWPMLTMAEADGGSGLGLAEAVAIIEPLGRNLCATPLPNTIIAAEILNHFSASDLLKRLSEGGQATLALSESEGSWDLDKITARAAFEGGSFSLSGDKIFLTHADSADIILASVLFEDQPHFIALTQTECADRLVREKVIDETQRSFRLNLDGLEIAPTALIGKVDAALFAHLSRMFSLFLTAEICGGMAGVLALLVEYLKTRKQFGKYIGAYQALKHPSVDILLGLEAARSHLYYAAGLVEANTEAIAAAHMAKAVASDGFTFATDRAIQFHGAFGFTYDCDAQLYMRRAIWCQSQKGDAAYHRQLLADLLL